MMGESYVVLHLPPDIEPQPTPYYLSLVCKSSEPAAASAYSLTVLYSLPEALRAASLVVLY